MRLPVLALTSNLQTSTPGAAIHGHLGARQDSTDTANNCFNGEHKSPPEILYPLPQLQKLAGRVTPPSRPMGLQKFIKLNQEPCCSQQLQAKSFTGNDQQRRSACICRPPSALRPQANPKRRFAEHHGLTSVLPEPGLLPRDMLTSRSERKETHRQCPD